MSKSGKDFCIAVSWLLAMLSNYCVLIWFHSYITCSGMLSNASSVTENTFFVMLAFGNFSKSTSCRWQCRLLWRCCYLFWKISLGLWTTPNVEHGVSFPKVQDCMQGRAKPRCKPGFLHHFTMPHMQVGQMLWRRSNQEFSCPSHNFSGCSPIK